MRLITCFFFFFFPYSSVRFCPVSLKEWTTYRFLWISSYGAQWAVTSYLHLLALIWSVLEKKRSCWDQAKPTVGVLYSAQYRPSVLSRVSMLQLIFDLRLILSPSPMRERKLWINFNLKSNLTWNKYTCTGKICTSGSLSRNYRLNWEELTSIGWLFVRYNKSGRPEDWNAAFRLIFLSFQTGMFETGNLPLIRFILPELLVMNFR